MSATPPQDAGINLDQANTPTLLVKVLTRFMRQAKQAIADIVAGTGIGPNLTIPGDLTVDTNTLKVDSANNRVGIGEATPAAMLHTKANDSASAPDDVRIENASTGAAGIQFKQSNATSNLWQVFLASGASPGFKIGRDALADYITISSAGITSIVQEAWTNFTLAGTWVVYSDATYGIARYKKDSCGNVHVHIMAGGGGAGTTIGTLPSGYRPGKRRVYICLTDSGAGRMDIATDGSVIHQSGGTTWVSILVCFPADQ